MRPSDASALLVSSVLALSVVACDLSRQPTETRQETGRSSSNRYRLVRFEPAAGTTYFPPFGLLSKFEAADDLALDQLFYRFDTTTGEILLLGFSKPDPAEVLGISARRLLLNPVVISAFTVEDYEAWQMEQERDATTSIP